MKARRSQNPLWRRFVGGGPAQREPSAHVKAQLPCPEAPQEPFSNEQLDATAEWLAHIQASRITVR